jgi:hypothetical protein
MPDPWSYAAKTRNEYAEQVALFMWAAVAQRFGPEIANRLETYTVPGWAKRVYDTSQLEHNINGKNARPMPELEWLHAIKNQGHGDAIRGAQSKAEGVKAGVPDTMLPITRGAHIDGMGVFQGCMTPGFYLELKRRKSARGAEGKLSPDQIRWHAHLVEAGYKVGTYIGWELARDALCEYLGRTQ